MRLVFDEHVAAGVATLLREMRPDLLSGFEKVLKESNFSPAEKRRGASIAGKFDGEIAEADYEVILRLLRETRSKLGFSTMIGPRNINLILNAWLQADQRPRLST